MALLEIYSALAVAGGHLGIGHFDVWLADHQVPIQGKAYVERVLSKSQTFAGTRHDPAQTAFHLKSVSGFMDL